MIHIVTDTTSCLSFGYGRRHNVPIISQVIHFGEDSYLEGIDIDTETFMSRLTSSTEMPRTAAPPPEMFGQVFQRLAPLGEPILCIHPSAEVSGTVRSASLAAQEFPGADIRVIDTRLIASPLGTIVNLAVGWAEEGLDIDTIETRVRALTPRARVYFVVATLEFLARGGRIGKAAALLGSLLQVKPILTVNDGRVDQFERQRTQGRALARLSQLVLEQAPRDGNSHLAIMHAAVATQAQALAQDLGKQLGIPADRVPIMHMPPAIVTHAGPGLLGVSFFLAS
jgi:DegV family protein with EDD domain